MNEILLVALGGIIALLGVVVEARLRRAERQADVREKRRQDAAALVGPALAALRDSDPNAMVGVLRGNPRADEALSEKWAAWLSAQANLEVLGAMYPDSEVSRLCDSVIDGGTKLLGRLHQAIKNGEAQSEKWWEEIAEIRERAVADARSLVRAVLDQPA